MVVSRLDSEHERLVRLIRRVAREEAWYVLDEHLDEYEHQEKPAEDFNAVYGGEHGRGE
jgi:hypothetical protein